MNIELSHDIVRKDGVWTCVNCGMSGSTITDVNEVKCSKQPKNSRNVVDAIAKKGKFA